MKHYVSAEDGIGAIYQSTSERTTPGRVGNLTRLMRSRHATVSQLARRGRLVLALSAVRGDVGRLQEDGER